MVDGRLKKKLVVGETILPIPRDWCRHVVVLLSGALQCQVLDEGGTV